MNIKLHLHKNKHLYFSTKTLFVFLTLGLMMTSCYKDRYDLDMLKGGEYNPELAAPLLKSRLTMADIIKDSVEEWKEYPDGLLSLVYRDTISSKLANLVIDIPDQEHDTALNLTLPPGMIPGDNAFKIFQLKTKLQGANNEKIDEIFFRNGYLDFEIETDLNHDCTVDIIIPQLAKYGVTFYQTITIPASPTGTSHTITASFPIGLHTATFTHPNNDNVIDEYVEVRLQMAPRPDNSPYDLKLTQRLRDIEYYTASGYFGQYAFDIEKQSFGISLFDNRVVSDIFLSDPMLSFNIHSSYGIPMEIKFDELYVEKGSNQLNFSVLPTYQIPASPGFGQWAVVSDTLHSGNSNLIDIFAFQPKKVYMKESLKSNPTGLQVPNFIMDSSRVFIDVALELPLHGKALEFTLSDSVAINIDPIKGIQSVDLRFNLSNTFPAEAFIQVYLTDSAGVILDSLFNGSEKVLSPAPVGAAPDYRTTGAVNHFSVINFTGTKLQSLYTANFLKFVAKLSTTGGGTSIVKIYSDYYIDFNVSTKINYITDL